MSLMVRKASLGIEPSGRLIHAQGVKVRDLGELLAHIAVTANHAAAITQHAHEAAVLPMANLVFVGKFKLAEQIGGTSGSSAAPT